MEEYDFINDSTPNLGIELHPRTFLAGYQKHSLQKVFVNGRARSGIIVLPCGAGKSITGISAACILNKPVLLMCSNSVSVEQWRNQFAMWSTIPHYKICRFTSIKKELPIKSGNITITTYTMIAFSGRRSDLSRKIATDIVTREWGLLLLDEVHIVPSQIFRSVLGVIKSHCKLGLSGTLVREDEQVEDLNFLIGPKLFEGSWLDITLTGHISKVLCYEVRCQMNKNFYQNYLRTKNENIRQLMYFMNPNKIQTCQNLIFWHEKAGHKIIVFSDNVLVLKVYAKKLRRPCIYGASPHFERFRSLKAFKNSGRFVATTLFLSKIGDNSLDVPEANVLIQISSQGGSRRQEAQRLGRILRARKHVTKHPKQCAYFYNLLTFDTPEMYCCEKRQRFLINQGYFYEVITDFMVPRSYDKQFLLVQNKNDIAEDILEYNFI
eukprot:gnl/MRDRNA2_/MRDRNA2_85992_c1_seq1.p1 gnl/MRDRNA2_/MRDRNA2_85992_c1~~gnl/MRDRNA2_/MRDRNA2_85992_c1_seq1.p1  ORF type:complete len:436 (-),score=-10.83 gnl/MRDRNA2_/MRDRNA2_85992_c1_seq1:319-1626(-)